MKSDSADKAVDAAIARVKATNSPTDAVDAEATDAAAAKAGAADAVIMLHRTTTKEPSQ